MLSFHNHRKVGPVTEYVGLCFRNLDGHEVLPHMLASTDRLPQIYSPKHTEHFQMQNGEELFLSWGGGTNKIKKPQCSKHEFDFCLLTSDFYLECITNNNTQN